jgi:hypothetical protein
MTSVVLDERGYAAESPVYLEQGWASPFPLPRGKKHPPPKGVTGNGARPATSEQQEVWRDVRQDDGVGLYLTDGLLAVDIDNYAKGDRPVGRALEVVAEVEARARCAFPPTWTLRTDATAARNGCIACRKVSGGAPISERALTWCTTATVTCMSA